MLCITCFWHGVLAWVTDPVYHLHRYGHYPLIVDDKTADMLLARMN